MRRVFGLVVLAALLGGAAPTPPPAARLEITHPGRGHEVHLSGAAVAVAADGVPVVTWASQEGNDNLLYAARPGRGAPVRVNPSGTAVDSLHQPPGIAAGPQGEIYVTWSARKPVPVGGLFASDLYLSRSLDGGATWNQHVRLNDDQPTSHSFEGLAVAPDGTVLVAWIETRDGKAATMLARVSERGTRVAEPIRLDTGETCVCCRVDVAAGPGENVDVLWRKVFPDNVRDMVLGVSRDGGRTLSPLQSLSPAIKAFAPAVAATPGGFIIVWHEEQFPSIKTVVQTLTLGEGAR